MAVVRLVGVPTKVDMYLSQSSWSRVRRTHRCRRAIASISAMRASSRSHSARKRSQTVREEVERNRLLEELATLKIAELEPWQLDNEEEEESSAEADYFPSCGRPHKRLFGSRSKRRPFEGPRPRNPGDQCRPRAATTPAAVRESVPMTKIPPEKRGRECGRRYRRERGWSAGGAAWSGRGSFSSLPVHPDLTTAYGGTPNTTALLVSEAAMLEISAADSAGEPLTPARPAQNAVPRASNNFVRRPKASKMTPHVEKAHRQGR